MLWITILYVLSPRPISFFFPLLTKQRTPCASTIHHPHPVSYPVPSIPLTITQRRTNGHHRRGFPRCFFSLRTCTCANLTRPVRSLFDNAEGCAHPSLSENRTRLVTPSFACACACNLKLPRGIPLNASPGPWPSHLAVICA